MDNHQRMDEANLLRLCAIGKTTKKNECPWLLTCLDQKTHEVEVPTQTFTAYLELNLTPIVFYTLDRMPQSILGH